MRLYSGKVPVIASEIVRALVSSKDIECETEKEAVLDIESVLNNYLRIEREATDAAKDAIQSHNLPMSELGRLKTLAAERLGIKTGDETLDYLLDQIVEILMHSANVAEVFSEDVVLRRKMVPILKRHMAIDEDIEREVRGHLKHVQEGTRTWEIEYARVADEIRRRKGLG